MVQEISHARESLVLVSLVVILALDIFNPEFAAVSGIIVAMLIAIEVFLPGNRIVKKTK